MKVKKEIAAQILTIMKNHNSKKVSSKGFNDVPTFYVEGVDKKLTLKRIEVAGFFTMSGYTEELFIFTTSKVDYNDEWDFTQITAEGLTSILNWISENEDTLFKSTKTTKVSKDEVTTQIINIMKEHNCEELVLNHCKKVPTFETNYDTEKYTLAKIELHPTLAFSGSTKFGDGDIWQVSEITTNSLVKILTWMDKNKELAFNTQK